MERTESTRANVDGANDEVRRLQSEREEVAIDEVESNGCVEEEKGAFWTQESTSNVGGAWQLRTGDVDDDAAASFTASWFCACRSSGWDPPTRARIY